MKGKQYRSLPLCPEGGTKWYEYVHGTVLVWFDWDSGIAFRKMEEVNEILDIYCAGGIDERPVWIDVEEDVYDKMRNVSEDKDRLIILAEALEECKVSRESIEDIEYLIRNVPYEDLKEKLKKAIVKYKMICLGDTNG